MSDIIRCKDCKYLQAWRSDPEVIKKYGQLYECGLLVLTCPSPDDYCSKAKRKEEDCFQPNSNEKISSQQDHNEEVAKAFQLGFSFGFIDGLKESEEKE